MLTILILQQSAIFLDELRDDFALSNNFPNERFSFHFIPYCIMLKKYCIKFIYYIYCTKFIYYQRSLIYAAIVLNVEMYYLNKFVIKRIFRWIYNFHMKIIKCCRFATLCSPATVSCHLAKIVLKSNLWTGENPV